MNIKYNMKKKGVSPVIATVLLISIVIILGVIIFLWARGFVEESAQKSDRAVDMSCDDINFEAGYNAGKIDVVNRGNVPIYGFNVKARGAATILVTNIQEQTLAQGASNSFDYTREADTELHVIPMILGETESGGKVVHTCDDSVGFPIAAI